MENLDSCEIVGLWGEQCEYNLENIDHPASTAWTVLKWMCIVWSALLLVASVSAFCYSKWLSRTHEVSALQDQSRLFSNVQTMIFLLVAAKSINFILLVSIQPPLPIPVGQKSKIPYAFVIIFYHIDVPFCYALFSTLIFHWLEVYLKAVDVLKREQMLQKINSNFQPNVTLPYVLSSASKISYIKIPLACLVIFSFILGILTGIIYQVATYPQFKSFTLSFGIFFMVLIVTEGVGYIVIGNYLVSILPPNLRGKVRHVTIKFSGYSVLFMLFWSITWPINRRMNRIRPGPYVAILFLTALITLVFTTMVFSHLIRFKRVHPYIFLLGSKTRSTTSSEEKKSSQEKGKARAV